MTGFLPVAVLAHVVALPYEAPARDVRSTLVEVRVRIDGQAAPLYPAPDGSQRHYLEARRGAHYELDVTNRTGERIGVLMTVDGLNVISGVRRPTPERGEPGRMYVLDPWDSTTVSGWRTSLDDVRRFTFVDERASYAARTGQANAKMGWIEVQVYRESRPLVTRPRRDDRISADEAEAAKSPSDPAAPRAQPESPAACAADLQAGRRAEERSYADIRRLDAEAGALGWTRPDTTSRRTSPGTGWGPRAEGRAVLVDFQPAASPSDRVTLRYEYAAALEALGIFVDRFAARDRLHERDRGDAGFARPPRR